MLGNHAITRARVLITLKSERGALPNRRVDPLVQSL
jgi:hypothetical protein